VTDYSKLKGSAEDETLEGLHTSTLSLRGYKKKKKKKMVWVVTKPISHWTLCSLLIWCKFG